MGYYYLLEPPPTNPVATAAAAATEAKAQAQGTAEGKAGCEDGQLAAMSLRDLKLELKARQVDMSSFLEKSEFVLALQQARGEHALRSQAQGGGPTGKGAEAEEVD